MREKAVIAYSALPAKNQARFLARLAPEMTVWGRDSYKVLTGNDAVSAALLTAYNELQHKISAHVMHLLEDNNKRYPDHVFINILFDMAPSAHCEEKMAGVFDDLYESCRKGNEI